jgi:hypothetical protein
MKKIQTILYFIATFVIGTMIANAQASDWVWAKSAVCSGEEYGRGVASDHSGNVFVTGYFSSQPMIFGTTVLPNMGQSDIFIAKYNQAGAILWARSIGGSWLDFGVAIAADSMGNSYVTGYFQSDSMLLGTYMHNAGMFDFFIAKFNPAGDLLWAKTEGGSKSDYVINITSDRKGNVYAGGSFESDSITLGLTVLKSNLYDLFIVKYDSTGNVLWAKAGGGKALVSSLTADAASNLYVTGFFKNSSLTFGAYTLTSSDSGEIFIVKYDTDGNVIWAKSEGGTGEDAGNALTIDKSGNIYLTGSFQSPSITFGTTTLINQGSRDIFIVKYDTAGNVIRARSIGGNSSANSFSINSDPEYNIYISGNYFGSLIVFDSTILNNAGELDMFIAKYDSSGKLLWAHSKGGSGIETANGVTTNKDGDVYVAGSFSSATLDFGTNSLYNNGNQDLFVAKLKGISLGNLTASGKNYTPAIFPNPGSGRFVISGLSEGTWKIMIYSVTGENIYQASINDMAEIDLTVEPAGLYFYTLQNENAVLKTGKIILE